MRYSKTLLLPFLIAILVCFIVKVNGENEPEEELNMYEVDSNGKVISHKKVKQNENGDVSQDEDIVIGNDDDDDSGTEIGDLEEDPDVDNETFMEEFITIHTGDFIYNPSEIDNNTNDEPEITESVNDNEKENKIEGRGETEEEEDEKNEKNIENKENKEMEEEIEKNENDHEDEDVEYVTEYVNEEMDNKEAKDTKSSEDEVVEVEVEIVMDEKVTLIKNKDMREFFKSYDRMILGCFESLENNNYFNYRNASKAILEDSNGDELIFITINDKECRNTVKRFTGISMFKNDVVYCVFKRCYQYSPADLENPQKFKKFIEGKELPVISEYDSERKEEYKHWNLPFLVYLNNDETKTKKDISKFLGGIAEEHKDDFVVLVSNEKNFDIDTLDEPKNDNVLLYAPEFQTLYSIQEILEENDAIDEVAIKSFIHQYEKGYLTPKLIFQDFEQVWNPDGFVINGVPRYYYPTVLNPTRDSLVIFYKSDCPFSKEFLKTFEKIGRKYANYRTKFSVVKYEAEEQKIPKMSLWRKLEGYPTVVLFKANPLSRNKKSFYIYPENVGRSAVTLDRWVQNYSFYKPKAIFTEEDYKEKEILEADYDDLEINAEEEERINNYLEDPDLIFTRYGYGKEIQVVDDDDDESGEEEGDFYFDNVNTKKEIPMTGTYYELVATTYTVKISNYTPPPSIYDDEDEDKE